MFGGHSPLKSDYALVRFQREEMTFSITVLTRTVRLASALRGVIDHDHALFDA